MSGIIGQIDQSMGQAGNVAGQTPTYPQAQPMVQPQLPPFNPSYTPFENVGNDMNTSNQGQYNPNYAPFENVDSGMNNINQGLYNFNPLQIQPYSSSQPNPPAVQPGPNAFSQPQQRGLGGLQIDKFRSRLR